MRGKILKGIGGFYYIHANDESIYECKAKGGFRNQNIKPAVGDDVEIDIIDKDKYLGNIVDILPRKNKLVRPAVCNVDQAIIIFALANPQPNYNLLDRFLIMMDRQDIKTIICLNKCDLVAREEAERIRSVYEKCGYEVLITSTKDEVWNGIDSIKHVILDKTTVFAGPSGVGKSSMLNTLNNSELAKTGELSEKVMRGKHTTRHSELICIGGDTYIMDTPGFTSLYVEDMEPNALKEYFNEFVPYQPECRFNGCVHINEPDCRVKDALAAGEISKLRYDNYVQMYDELKSKRRW